MRRTPSLTAVSAALTFAALGAGPLATALSATTPPPASVTRVSVVPAAGKAAVVIGVDSAVAVRDFTLTGPHRIVIDLSGARLRARARAYDKVARGGIVNLRVAQNNADVVRVVVELDSARQYKITRSGGELRVTVTGPASEFAAWHLSPSRAVAAKADAAKADAKADAAKAAAAKADARPAEIPAEPAAGAVAAPTAAALATLANARAAAEAAPKGRAAPSAQTASAAKAPEPAPAAQPASPAPTEAPRQPAAPRQTVASKMPAEPVLEAPAEPMLDAAGPAAEPAAAAPAARPAEQRRSVRGMMPVSAGANQPRITVTYQDADIRDVLAAFAAFSGRTIVAGREVAGTVSAEIRDQPWDVALKAILSAQGLSAGEDATGIIVVDSYKNIVAREASEPLETRLIALNYAKASSLQETVKLLLAKDCVSTVPGGNADAGGAGSMCRTRGSVAIDTSTNTLLVTEAPSRMGDLLGYIQALDVRTPQVAIKAKIIFVSRSDIEELGLTYDLGSPQGFSTRLLPRANPGATPAGDAFVRLGGDALVGVANAKRNFASTAALNLIYSTAIGNYTLSTFLDALQEVRLADTQAEPSIVTLDNRAASILVGEETPIRVVDASSPGATAVASVTFKESGIRLDVTPHITNNRQIMMTLHAEQSQLQAAAADIGYTFLKRRADSQVLVNDGETAVFGGLTLTQVTTAKSGIPFLVDLPLIGRLFGETRVSESKQDMLVLITPHIIDEGETPRSR